MKLHVATRADDADKHQNDVNQLIFKKGKLYSAADDGKIKVWASDLKFEKEIQAHKCSIFSIAVSDTTLYSCSNDGTVKAWDLNTLAEKRTIVKDIDVEFWKVQYANGVLYAGDDQGNVRLYKDEVFYGSINVAVPVKDLVVKDNLVFASKDNDVIVTDLQLQGEKPQFGVKATIVGRGPLVVIGDKVIILSRDGRNLILNQIDNQQHLKELTQVPCAHELIVNASTASIWDTPLVFTGGWDKQVKQWRISNNKLELCGSATIDFVINTLTVGEKNQVYAAGGDGHIVRLDL